MPSCSRLVLLALVFAVVARAQHAPPAARATIQDLSGAWDFAFDPAASGETQGFPEARGVEWRKVHVPGSPQVELSAHADAPNPADAAQFYRGAMWFHTKVDFTPDSRLGAVLHLSQVVLRSKVWVNGKLAGSSSVPYQDVTYDVAQLLRAGANDLVIEVNNLPLARGIPDSKWRGWWDDGGLIGPVTLERRPLAHTDTSATTTMLPGGRWQLALLTDVARPVGEKSTHVSYLLSDAGGKAVWRAERTLKSQGGAERLAVQAELASVLAWAPEHPVLYRLTVTTETPGTVDEQSFRIGFRQIEVRGSQLVLNGAPLVLRGINRHQFLAGQGMTLTAAQDRTDLADLKALGANFTRLAHYSQAQDVYDACDELGLLVWTEIPAWQTAAATLADPAVWKNDAEPQLRAMVTQHRNHASVIIYSVANEIPSDKPEGAAYVAKAISFVRSLDPSRLVTFASDKREKDLAFGTVDFIAVNEYFGWYYGSLEDVGPMLDEVHARLPGKPVLVSEFGAESIAGWDPATAHSDGKGVTKNFSFEFQQRFMASHLRQIYAPQRAGYVVGGTIWVYNDFPDPHRIGGDQPVAGSYRNCKGLVTMDRQRKPAYDTVQKFYLELASSDAQAGAKSP